MSARDQATINRELVEERGRSLSHIGFRLRRLVWADTEVRDVLLVAADDRAVWDELVDWRVGRRERAGANDGAAKNTTQPFGARCVVGVSGAAAGWRRVKVPGSADRGSYVPNSGPFRARHPLQTP